MSTKEDVRAGAIMDFREGGLVPKPTGEVKLTIEQYKDLLRGTLQFEKDKEDLWKQVVCASISSGSSNGQAYARARGVISEWKSEFKKEAGQ